MTGSTGGLSERHSCAKLGVLVGLVLVLLLAACSGPLGDDDAASTTPGDGTEQDAGPLPTMPIVTPTPFDPESIAPTSTPRQQTPLEIPETYVVQEGDSLYSIAARFDVEIAELVAVNNLADPNDIRVGQELQIPQPE